MFFTTNLLWADINYSFEKVGASHVHIIIFDPNKYDLTPVTANDIRGNRKETVKTIAKNTGALAAINGGFFHLNSSAVGILKISGHWLGIAYKPRSAMAWNNKEQFLFDYPDTKSFIKTQSGVLKINSMNNTKAKNKSILFSQPLHRQDIISPYQSCYIAFSDSKLVNYSQNALEIPENGYVYYSPDKNLCSSENIKNMGYFKLDIHVTPTENKDLNNWNSMPFIMGGIPMLVYDGKLIDNSRNNKVQPNFANKRHGRTAAGYLNNNNVILVIVEEDPFEKDSGMSIIELATFMLAKDCKYAINLDGGSSTSMFLDKKIVKHSTSKGYANINLVSNALIVTKK